MWKSRLVCMDLYTDPPDDICGYDLDTLETFTVTDDDEYQIWPRIHEDRVVWQDFRLGPGAPTGSWEGSAIFTKDLSTENVLQVSDGAAIAAFPDVFGDRIVWLDYRHCDDPTDQYDFDNVEVYGYNLETGVEFRVTELPGRPKNIPRIWNGVVLAEMQTLDGGVGIFEFDLPPEAY
ncbi:MAG: hypothetical protein R6V85_20300 [Polyangia bacterium]